MLMTKHSRTDLLHLFDLDGLDQLGNVAGEREHEKDDEQAHECADDS